MVALYMQRYHMLYRHVKHFISVLQSHDIIPNEPKLLAGTASLPLAQVFLFASSTCLGQDVARSTGLQFGQLRLLLIMGMATGFAGRLPGGELGRGGSGQGFAASLCFQGSYGVTYNALQAIDTSCHLCCDFCYSLQKKKKITNKQTEKGQRENL